MAMISKYPSESTRNKFLIWLLLVFLLLFACYIYFGSEGSSFAFPIIQQSTISFSGFTRSTEIKADNSNPDTRKCDLWNGTWVRDYSGPIYTNMTCPDMPDNRNCEKYGKDHDFVKWRWKPHGCHLPRFDPEQFLNTMKGTTLAFFGDSIARNHKDSLLCLLSQVESPQNTYKNSEKEEELTKWHFETYNFTVIHAWSKYLVRMEETRVNGSRPQTGIFLDEPDPHWVNQLHNQSINYVVLNAGHWFNSQLLLHEHKRLIGSAVDSNIGVPTLGRMFAYRSILQTALNYFKYNAGSDLRLVVVRTFSPSHFESGSWNKGGLCERTRPVLDIGPVSGTEWDSRNMQLDEVEKAQRGTGTEHAGVKFAAMDVTLAMQMRPDGHPGSHWDNRWNKGYSDCVHWCMPGAVDTWNEMLFQMIKNLDTN